MPEPSIWGIHDTQGFGTTIPSGCGWYRILWPFDQLKAHGWKTGYGLGLPSDWAPDIIVGQRFDQAEAVPVWELLKGQFRLVYEIDDDPFSVDAVNWLAYKGFSQEDVLGTIRSCAQIADMVTVTTKPLAQVFRQFNDNVVIIPNCIPEWMTKRRRRDNHKLTIGWGGGASHMRDLAMIARAWRDVIDTTGVRGHFIGTDYRNMLRPDGFDCSPWETDPAGYFKAIDFDIGLAPIAEHPFAVSKSHIKALEYAALGIPCIASDCEAYRDFVIDGVTGFLVRTPAEWREAMMMLVRDANLRAEMGHKARELACTWTVEGNWHRWADAYNTLLEGDSERAASRIGRDYPAGPLGGWEVYRP